MLYCTIISRTFVIVSCLFKSSEISCHCYGKKLSATPFYIKALYPESSVTSNDWGKIRLNEMHLCVCRRNYALLTELTAFPNNIQLVTTVAKQCMLYFLQCFTIVGFETHRIYM